MEHHEGPGRHPWGMASGSARTLAVWPKAHLHHLWAHCHKVPQARALHADMSWLPALEAEAHIRLGQGPLPSRSPRGGSSQPSFCSSRGPGALSCFQVRSHLGRGSLVRAA